MACAMNSPALRNEAAQPDTLDDCWNRIGVRGDRSCPQLTSQVHCHNCPVYSTAARTLLNAPAPEGYSAHWGEYLAQPTPAAEVDTHSVMIFRLGAEWLAIPTHLCVEVTGSRAVHSLPHRRNVAVLGVTNVRGGLLLCISLGAILEVAADVVAKAAPRTVLSERMLVLGWPEGAVAAPVDEVHGVRRFRAQDLQDVPATVAKAQATYTQGILQWDEHSVGLLDAELLCYTINRSLA
jgi:chemotaxis-related protein WspD